VPEKKRPTTSGEGGVARDRDEFVRKTPPTGIAAQLGVPEPLPDEITGQYEGEQLEEMRARRAEQSPETSITKLEKKHDALAGQVGGLSQSFTDFRVEHAEQMGGMQAAFGTLAGEVKGLATVVKDNRDKDHLTFTAKVDVDRAKHISDVNVKQAEDIDRIAARKARREFWFKIGAAILGGGVLGKLLHMAGLW